MVSVMNRLLQLICQAPTVMATMKSFVRSVLGTCRAESEIERERGGKIREREKGEGMGKGNKGKGDG